MISIHSNSFVSVANPEPHSTAANAAMRDYKVEATIEVAEAGDNNLWPLVNTCDRWLLLCLNNACI